MTLIAQGQRNHAQMNDLQASMDGVKGQVARQERTINRLVVRFDSNPVNMMRRNAVPNANQQR